jgi:hypothetical protein
VTESRVNAKSLTLIGAVFVMLKCGMV